MSKDWSPSMRKLKNTHQNNSFSSRLLNWHRTANTRQMPWKGERDPYRIWLSEIILQQTRVEQGLAYYQRFISAYPTVSDLAAAPDDEVFKLWEGLGYYSRCRNLLASARLIAQKYGGRFPEEYDLILQLRGVGPYTAAAIASFAFDLPYAVLDGNVFRVLARYTGSHLAVDSTAGKKHFTALANELLDKNAPALYNQAIMDFGATICKPQNPLCSDCIFNADCRAYLEGTIDQLPVKEKKTGIRKRWFTYFIFRYKDEIAIYQRRNSDIWQQLYEFPQIESPAEPDMETILDMARELKWVSYIDVVDHVSVPFKQQLSHQLINARFITIRLQERVPLMLEEIWLTAQELSRYALPRIVNKYLDSHKIQSAG